jgi:hypothetical protein
MRKRAVIISAAAGVLGLAGLIPTAASASGSTTAATFTVTGGTLSLSVPTGSPSAVNLGSAAAGSLSLSGQLGSETVTDTRGLSSAAWTLSASTTAFTTGSATTQETVAATNVGYYAGAGTAGTGQLGTFTPVGTSLTPVTLALSPTATTVGAWAGTGNNTVTFNPTITFTLLPSQVAGTYTGTITQSVS